jgi:hypothetical protein
MFFFQSWLDQTIIYKYPVLSIDTSLNNCGNIYMLVYLVVFNDIRAVSVIFNML